MSNIINMLQGGILFVGQLPHLGPHSTISWATIVGLDDVIVKKVAGENGWLQARCFAFNGMLRHETIFNGAVGILFADPGGAFSSLLAREMGGRPLIANPSWTNDFLRTCLEIRNARDPSSYPEILNRGFPLNNIVRNRIITGDARIARIMEAMTRSPHESADSLARKIGMSPSWVQHEFKNAVGMPVRTSRKWFRIRAAATALRQGSSLADAALLSGFYDQSHFTNVFRGIFGIPPNLAFSGEHDIQWYMHDSPALDAEELLARP